jgi:hypothetical protein
VRFLGILAGVWCLLLLAACGGGGSSTPATPTITLVVATCSPTSIQSQKTSQCTATVSGTGSFSSSVIWTASGGGTINATSGLFTADIVPFSTQVTITATSVQDSTKTGSTSITVAATGTVSSPNPTTFCVTGGYSNPVGADNKNFPVTTNQPFGTNGTTCGGTGQVNCAALACMNETSSATTLVMSGYLGWTTASQNEQSQSRAMFWNVAGNTGAGQNPTGYLYIGGRTSDTNFTGTAGAFHSAWSGGSAVDNAVLTALSFNWSNPSMPTVSVINTALFGDSHSSISEQTVYGIAGINDLGTTITNESGSQYTCNTTTPCLIISMRFHNITDGTLFSTLGWTGYTPGLEVRTKGGCTTGDGGNANTIMAVTPDLSKLIAVLEICGTSGNPGSGFRGRAVLDSSGNVYSEGDTRGTLYGITSGTCANSPANSGDVYKIKADLSDTAWGLCLGTGYPATTLAATCESGLSINSTTGEIYFYCGIPASNPVANTDFFAGSNGNGYQTVPLRASTATGAILGVNMSTGNIDYSTYLGGSSTVSGQTFTGNGEVDWGQAIKVDPSTGDVILEGVTAYQDFPGMTGGYLTSNPSAVPGATGPGPVTDFICRMSSNLTILRRCTYFGGSGANYMGGNGFLFLDPNNSNNIWTMTNTASVKGNAYGAPTMQPTTSNAFTSSSSANGATAYGCSDGTNNIYGMNPAIYALNSSLTQLVYGTCFGPDEAGLPYPYAFNAGFQLRDMAMYPPPP